MCRGLNPAALELVQMVGVTEEPLIDQLKLLEEVSEGNLKDLCPGCDSPFKKYRLPDGRVIMEFVQVSFVGDDERHYFYLALRDEMKDVLTFSLWQASDESDSYIAHILESVFA